MINNINYKYNNDNNNSTKCAVCCSPYTIY